jgi:hypothetical protein
MKPHRVILTPTVVVELGAIVCTAGTLLLAKLDLSPEDRDLLRALAVVMVGFFFMAIGYAQSLHAEKTDGLKKPPSPEPHSE